MTHFKFISIVFSRINLKLKKDTVMKDSSDFFDLYSLLIKIWLIISVLVVMFIFYLNPESFYFDLFWSLLVVAIFIFAFHKFIVFKIDDYFKSKGYTKKFAFKHSDFIDAKSEMNSKYPRNEIKIVRLKKRYMKGYKL